MVPFPLGPMGIPYLINSRTTIVFSNVNISEIRMSLTLDGVLGMMTRQRHSLLISLLQGRRGKVPGSATGPHLLGSGDPASSVCPPVPGGRGFLSCHLPFSFPVYRHLDN